MYVNQIYVVKRNPLSIWDITESLAISVHNFVFEVLAKCLALWVY